MVILFSKIVRGHVRWLVGRLVTQTYKTLKTANSVVFLHSYHLSCLTTPLLGSGPEGADDLCFHTGEISPPSSPPPPPSLSTPFEAHILALRLIS